MTPDLPRRDLVLVLLVMAVWGFTFVLMRYAIAEVPPFALAALRFTLAAIPACFIVRPPAMPLPGLVGYGAAIGIFQFGFTFLGMKLGMSAGLTSLTVQVSAFFTIALGVIFTGDRPHAANLAGAALAAVGVAILALDQARAGAGGSLVGFALVLCGAFSWAVGNIVAKRAGGAHGVDMLSLVVWSSFVAPLPLAVLSYFVEGGSAAWQAVVQMSPRAWLAVLTMAWPATLFGYAAFNHLMHKHSPSIISPFTLLIPVAGVGGGALFLGESLSRLQALGAVGIFAGLVVNVYGRRIAERFRTAARQRG